MPRGLLASLSRHTRTAHGPITPCQLGGQAIQRLRLSLGQQFLVISLCLLGGPATRRISHSLGQLIQATTRSRPTLMDRGLLFQPGGRKTTRLHSRPSLGPLFRSISP